MSEGLVGVLIVCMTVLCIALVISRTRLILASKEARRTADPEEARRQEAERMRERIERAPKPAPGFDWDEVAARLAEEGEAEAARQAGPDDTPSDHGMPLPVDPARPPSVKTYRPRPDSVEPPPRCVCHRLPVQPGDKVLWWPMPGSEEVRVFCQRGDAS